MVFLLSMSVNLVERITGVSFFLKLILREIGEYGTISSAQG